MGVAESLKSIKFYLNSILVTYGEIIKKRSYFGLILLVSAITIIATGIILIHPEPAFEVGDLALSHEEVEVGETIVVTARVRNKGNAEGIYTATLVMDGKEIKGEPIMLAPGEEKEIRFQLVVDKVRTYAIDLDGLKTTLSVTACLERETGLPENYLEYFPPMLAYDFYPNNLSRENLLARLPEAVQKTGSISRNESWEGVIKITGDLSIQQGITLTIKPGTIVFVSARSDDQRGGNPAPKDYYNPRDPVADENYVKNRVEIYIYGSLIARGTKEQPIIITSDALNPQSDDWIGIKCCKGGQLEFHRVVIEYCRGFGIGSATIRQSILRNMLECIVIMGEDEDLLTISPTITQSYLYNAGHHVITVRSGSPVITHNIIRARPDMEFPGFEYGALACDFFSKPVIGHNFIEGGPRVPYDGYVHGDYYENIDSHGVLLASGFGVSVRYNTFYGCSGIGLETFSSGAETVEKPWIIENNNFLSNGINLKIFSTFTPEPSDLWQQQLLKNYPVISMDNVSLINNYWGSRDEREIMDLIKIATTAKVSFKPFENCFIENAFPNWQEFGWF